MQDTDAAFKNFCAPESIFLVALWWLSDKNTPAMQEMRIQSLGQEDSLQEEMETGFRAVIKSWEGKINWRL